MKLIASLALFTWTVLCFSSQTNATTNFASQLPSAHLSMVDSRGFIEVFALRSAVAELELLQPKTVIDECQSVACKKAFVRADLRYRKARSVFMKEWGHAILHAISKGDEVAEVIWRNCGITPVIDRSALTSTCDNDPVRRKSAALRLREIGFEAAFDEDADGARSSRRELDRDKRYKLALDHAFKLAQAGVLGEKFPESYKTNIFANYARSPEELFDFRREKALSAALTMTDRAFTFDSSELDVDHAHSRLRLNRKPIGLNRMSWHIHKFPHIENDLSWGAYRTFLMWENRSIPVGGERDGAYWRLLSETLTRADQRIEYWLKRDSRWAVFLLHRRGHHEWIPEGTESLFGRLKSNWHGRWAVTKTFVDFQRQAGHPVMQASIQARGTQTAIQFDGSDSIKGECELRYSGGSSYIPENNSNIKSEEINTALGSLSSFYIYSALLEPFAPLNKRKAYRQVLVQCPQAEWPNNRNVHFFFLANDTLVEVLQPQSRGQTDVKEVPDLKRSKVTIRHWKRMGQLNSSTAVEKSLTDYDRQLALKSIAELATSIDQNRAEDEQAEALKRAAQVQVRAQMMTANVEQLIASLAVLRNENLYYDKKADFPENLTRLISMPGAASKACAAYRKNPPDPVLRFNLILVLYGQLSNKIATAAERPQIADCLRLALIDPHGWVRVEASSVFASVVEEKDRTLVKGLENDSLEDVRNYARNSLRVLDERSKVK
jgi:hypothetical protein